MNLDKLKIARELPSPLSFYLAAKLYLSDEDFNKLLEGLSKGKRHGNRQRSNSKKV